MTSDTPKPKVTLAKKKEMNKPKPALQSNSPFWVQLNSSPKRPKRS